LYPASSLVSDAAFDRLFTERCDCCYADFDQQRNDYMNFRKLAALSLVLAGLPTAALGGSIGPANVLAIDVQSGFVVLTLTSAIASSPACNTSGKFAFSLSDASGRAMLGSAQLAFALCARISVQGTNTCTTVGTSTYEIANLIGIYY
jgi:hypothetical protein